MHNHNKIWVVTLIAIVIAVGGYFFPLLKGGVVETVKDVVGAAGTRFPNGLTIGPNGSDNVEVRAGTCTLVVSASRLPVAGSSTVPASCAITGIVSGDAVFVSAPIDSILANASRKEYFSIVGAEASSTAGFAEVILLNGGAASSSFEIATTSASFLFFDMTR